MERQILFNCPRTGMTVQHLLVGTESEGTHVLVRCQACIGSHLLDITAGKLLGEVRGRDRLMQTSIRSWAMTNKSVAVTRISNVAIFFRAHSPLPLISAVRGV
ncbi:hypothetical protein JQ607_09985 [Bradyrhizobium liaoningense]|uniref:hypothetical protein n=1 Tax=Bradyrhizobium liaoningense TaxID=43992 RepID=UPI001BA72CCB|nr:hypothetical protein [Bradyrhizobium liaoningense]MBR0840516.1 hypothetical protein [Bradyrhizobium liaoningense]